MKVLSIFAKSILLVAFCFWIGAVHVASFNPDRAIYKWSPLWFNNYIRRAAVLHKRFRDEPIMKWTPSTFRSNFYKRDGCAKENSACSFVDEVTGALRLVPCCGELRCLPTGDYFTCSIPGSRNELQNGPDYVFE